MDRNLIKKYLKENEENYDEKEHLVLQINSNLNPAHTNLKKNVQIHPILHSLTYASYLIEYENKYSKRVDDIIKKVIFLQQQHPFDEYYGLWPLVLEEPINKMKSPDKNTAVFNLVAILNFYIKHKNIIPKDTLQLIKSSCFAATTFIVNRNTTLRYSHIVVEECYACVLCGEIFSRLEFVNFGMHKLEKFLHFTISCGDFFEFNSPVYSLITANFLKSILENIKNPRVLDAAQKLNKILWHSLASHYHYQTGQLSGPFTRTVNDFLDPDTSQIFEGFKEKQFSSHENINNNHSDEVLCPSQCYPFFTNKKTIEYSQRLIFKGETYPDFAYSYTATTYLQPEYTIGSFNHSEFWTESRPLIGYFGTTQSTYCVKVTCLLNGQEFSSSLLHCVQVKNSILGAVNFSTNRGVNYLTDSNLSNQKINISDLRLRFTIIGNTDALKIKQNRNTLNVNYKNLLINYNYNFYKSDIFAPVIELSETKNNLCYDLVFYNGKRKSFDFNSSECTICQFSLHFSTENKICTPVKNTLSNGILTSTQKYGDYELKLKTHVNPQDWVYLMINDIQSINGVKIETYAKDTEESALQYEFIVNSSSEIPMNTSDISDVTINSILQHIENLLSLDLPSIHGECENIFRHIRNSGISLDIAKRFAIRIITNIFEIAKNYSIIFENTINYEYSNVYTNLSQDNSINAIEKTTMNVIDKLTMDYKLHLNNTRKDNFINTVTQIIQDSFSDSSLSLSYIAEKINMDESHISKKFHKQTGMTYLQYLTRIRMEYAKKLIFDGVTDTDAIATQCGYDNISSFLRAFKKYTGSTLGSFKKNI